MNPRQVLGALSLSVLFLSAGCAGVSGNDAGGIRIEEPALVWPDGAPRRDGWIGHAEDPAPEARTNDGSGAIFNVSEPTIQAFLPSPSKATGAAVMVIPGGGFRFVSIHYEGEAVARSLAERGIAAFVLKYRVLQHRKDESPDDLRARLRDVPFDELPGPSVDDGFAALNMIRENADKYEIDPHRIGVIGFSAGGHIAGMLGLAKETATRPDFIGLVYGVPFGDGAEDIPPAHLPSPTETTSEPWLAPPPLPAPGALPPIFLAMAQDDVIVGLGFRLFYDLLFAAGYRPEMHLYARGGHGFAMQTTGSAADRFLEDYIDWMDAEGLNIRAQN